MLLSSVMKEELETEMVQVNLTSKLFLTAFFSVKLRIWGSAWWKNPVSLIKKLFSF